MLCIVVCCKRISLPCLQCAVSCLYLLVCVYACVCVHLFSFLIGQTCFMLAYFFSNNQLLDLLIKLAFGFID